MSIIRLTADKNDTKLFDNTKLCIVDDYEDTDYDFSQCKDYTTSEDLSDKIIFHYPSFELCNNIFQFRLILDFNDEQNYIKTILDVFDKSNSLICSIDLDTLSKEECDDAEDDGFSIDDYINQEWYIRYTNSPLTIKTKYFFFALSVDEITSSLSNVIYLIFNKDGSLIACYRVNTDYDEMIYCDSSRFSTLAVFREDTFLEICKWGSSIKD